MSLRTTLAPKFVSTTARHPDLPLMFLKENMERLRLGKLAVGKFTGYVMTRRRREVGSLLKANPERKRLEVEQELDVIRREVNPSLPSRLTSALVAPSLMALAEWKRVFRIERFVYKVEAEGRLVLLDGDLFVEASIAHLGLNKAIDDEETDLYFERFYEFAEDYWRGKEHRGELLEVVVDGKVTIIKDWSRR